MSTSSRKPRATSEAGVLSAATPTGELPRQHLAATLHSTCAVLRGFEAIREIQLKAAHQALANHEAFANKLTSRHEPADLLALQAEMLRVDLMDATAYWQQLGAATLHMQRQVIGTLVGAAQSEGEAMAAALPVLAGYFGQDGGPRQDSAQTHH